MPYCSECGTEVQDTASFCSECGADLSDLPPSESTEVTESDTQGDASMIVDSATTENTNNSWEIEGEEVDPKVLGASISIGIFVALLVGLGFSELGGAAFFMLLSLVGVTIYLNRRTTNWKRTIGTGLYIVAAWLILAPIMFYIGVAGQSGSQFAAVGAVLGMVIYGFIGLLLAIVVGGLGYFINKRVDA